MQAEIEEALRRLLMTAYKQETAQARVVSDRDVWELWVT